MGSFLGWLLDLLGRLVLGLWDAIVVAFSLLWSLLDAVLAPVMRPVLSVLNPLATTVGDGLYRVLDALGTTGGLIVLSIVFGVLSLFAFKYLSNQKAIERVNNDIKANLLALKLFKDELRVTFSAQGKLFVAILRLQWHMLRPILVLILPMMIVLAQMGIRYQWRPLAPGERTLVEARLAGAPAGAPMELAGDGGVEVEAGPIVGDGRAVWRVRATAPGRHTLTITDGLMLTTKELVVGAPGERVEPERGTRWTTLLLHPVEPPLPKGSSIESISVQYPSIPSRIHGSDWWLLSFFVVSMAAALVLKPVVGVKF